MTIPLKTVGEGGSPTRYVLPEYSLTFPRPHRSYRRAWRWVRRHPMFCIGLVFLGVQVAYVAFYISSGAWKA